MNAVVLYFLLLRATALSFSGFASVPVIREDLVVTRGVLTDEELNSAIAISQASPGPLGLYVVVLGYFVAGIPGALAGALALASPAILAIPIARAVRRHRDSQVRGALRGHRHRVVRADGDDHCPPGARCGAERVSSRVLAIVGFIALASGRVPPVVVIIVSACLGPLLA